MLFRSHRAVRELKADGLLPAETKLRSRSHSDADVQKSIAYRKWVKFYPL